MLVISSEAEKMPSIAALLKFKPPPLPLASEPWFQLPSASPIQFFDKHVSDALLLKRIVPLPSLPGILTQIASETISSETAKIKRHDEQELYPRKYGGDGIANIQNLVE